MVGQGDGIALVDVKGRELCIRVGEDPAFPGGVFQQNVTEDRLALGQLLAAVQLLLDPQDAVSFHGGSLLFIPYYKAEREGRQLLFLDRALRQLIQ